MLSSPVEAVAASQQASMQHHSTLVLGGGGPSKSGKRAKCSLCGRNSQEVGFPLADLLYLHRKNCHFRINKIALLPMVEHFSQLFLSLLLPPVIVRVLLEGAEGRKKNIATPYRLSRLKGPLGTLPEHPDFELFRTFRQSSRNSRAARHLPCAVIKLFRSVDIGPMAHIPCHVPRRSLASSGPSIDGEASQIARNIAFLGTQYGRAPYHPKL